ncbi:MAG: RluA family pseudouridine synthase [Pseudomonadota bacterium]
MHIVMVARDTTRSPVDRVEGFSPVYCRDRVSREWCYTVDVAAYNEVFARVLTDSPVRETIAPIPKAHNLAGVRGYTPTPKPMTEKIQSKQKVSQLDVTVDADGQRLDNFLLKHLKGVPKSHVYRIVRKGEVRVNRKRSKPEQRLNAGDQIRIPPIRTALRATGEIPAYWLKRIEKSILFEDDELIAIDKPSGLAAHGGSGIDFGLSDVLHRLRVDSRHWELAHRLDRDTSGCLIAAKNRQCLNAVQNQFRSGDVYKMYSALTMGHWRHSPTRVSAPLLKNQSEGGERIVKVNPEGKPAISRFSEVESFEGASLVEVEIETGRTHQIRVHAQHSGHPIAADARYGNRAFNKRVRACGLKRLFLHASKIRLRHRGRLLEITSALPDDLQNVLTMLAD